MDKLMLMLSISILTGCGPMELKDVEEMEVEWEYMHDIGSFPIDFEDISKEKFV